MRAPSLGLFLGIRSVLSVIFPRVPLFQLTYHEVPFFSVWSCYRLDGETFRSYQTSVYYQVLVRQL
jgi:hypothetical protein